MGLSELLIIVSMLFINSFFAAYEMALASLSLGKLKILAEQNRKGAKAALSMKSRMEASLAVVQIGITLAGAVAAATGGAGAEEKLSPYIQKMLHVSEPVSEFLAIAVIVLPLTSMTIIFGELIPKTIAIKKSEKVCLLLSPFMKGFSYIVYPSVVFFEWITKAVVSAFENRSDDIHSQGNIGLIELKAQASALKMSRVINSAQEKIILGAGNLSRLTVADIMIPDYDMMMLFTGDSLPDQFVRIHLDPYTRFPVTEKEGDPQSVIGYVNIKELIFLAKTHPHNPDVKEIVRPLINFNEDTTIGEAFSQMMKDHVHLSMVKNKQNKVVGMITIEDILEEVVGDMQDEFDRLPKHMTNIGRDIIVGGGVLVKVLLQTINREIQISNADTLTVSEWVKDNYDKKIRGGDVINVEGLKITIRKTKMNHVFEAMISF